MVEKKLFFIKQSFTRLIKIIQLYFHEISQIINTLTLHQEPLTQPRPLKFDTQCFVFFNCCQIFLFIFHEFLILLINFTETLLKKKKKKSALRLFLMAKIRTKDYKTYHVRKIKFYD